MSETHGPDVEAARAFVARVLDLLTQAVPFDGGVDTIPAWDSLGHVRILLAIEAETGRALDSELVATLRTVEDVA
nr:acyl carrier protein [Pseudaminobacter sp.]